MLRLSWGILLLILVLSVQRAEITFWLRLLSARFNWITDLFIRDNLTFIAGGIGETLRISVYSIMLAMILALLAALGRLSTIPPIYALSTFYVSLIRGTPLYLQIFFFFLALPQLGIILSGFLGWRTGARA